MAHVLGRDSDSSAERRAGRRSHAPMRTRHDGETGDTGSSSRLPSPTRTRVIASAIDAPAVRRADDCVRPCGPSSAHRTTRAATSVGAAGKKWKIGPVRLPGHTRQVRQRRRRRAPTRPRAREPWPSRLSSPAADGSPRDQNGDREDLAFGSGDGRTGRDRTRHYGSGCGIDLVAAYGPALRGHGDAGHIWHVTRGSFPWVVSLPPNR